MFQVIHNVKTQMVQNGDYIPPLLFMNEDILLWHAKKIHDDNFISRVDSNSIDPWITIEALTSLKKLIEASTLFCNLLKSLADFKCLAK